MCDLRQDTCLFGHGRVDPARTQVSPGVFGAFLHCDKTVKKTDIDNFSRFLVLHASYIFLTKNRVEIRFVSLGRIERLEF